MLLLEKLDYDDKFFKQAPGYFKGIACGRQVQELTQ